MKDDWTPSRIASGVFVGLLTAGILYVLARVAARGDAVGFDGGCGRFRVYAQNRWEDYGANVRAEPDPLARKIDAFGPNEIVAVDGWVRGEVGYPDNPPPWNSDVWFHVADGGWVSFAAVRAAPTSPDPTTHSPDGGVPAETRPECEGALR